MLSVCLCGILCSSMFSCSSLLVWIALQEALLGGWGGESRAEGRSSRGVQPALAGQRSPRLPSSRHPLSDTLSDSLCPTFSFTTASSSIYISPTSPLPSPSLSFLYSALCLVAPAFLCGLPLFPFSCLWSSCVVAMQFYAHLLAASLCGLPLSSVQLLVVFLCGMSCRRLCWVVGVGSAAKFCCDVLHL